MSWYNNLRCAVNDKKKNYIHENIHKKKTEFPWNACIITWTLLVDKITYCECEKCVLRFCYIYFIINNNNDYYY